PELCQIVVERMAQRYRWQITPEDVVLLPGIVVALNLACHAFGSPGEAVLVQPPVYPPILSSPISAHRRRLEARLMRQNDGSYAVDFDSFAAAITEDTRLFL